MLSGLLTRLGLRLGHFECWALRCAATGAGYGLALGLTLVVLGCRKRRLPPEVQVEHHLLYDVTTDFKAQLTSFMMCHGGRGCDAECASGMSMCWTATRGRELVGVVFVQAHLWTLRDSGPGTRETLYATWKTATHATLWDAVPTNDGFQSRVATTWSVSGPLVPVAVQSQGIGGALMRAVHRHAESCGASLSALELHVRKRRTGQHLALVQWYKRLGFVVVQSRAHDVHMVCFRDGLQETLHADAVAV